MSEPLKSKHAFGSMENIDSALDQGLVDAYDILFLDGDTEPKIGWIDKNGLFKLVKNKSEIVRVEELPTTDGDENVIYIYNNEGYIWNGNACIPMAKSADLVTLENQVATLEEQMNSKVDASTVQDMVKEYSDSTSKVIEF